MEHSLSLKLLQYQKGFEIRPTILLLLACLTSSSITRGEKPAFIAQSRHNKCQKIFFPFYFCYFYEDRVERRYAFKKKKKKNHLFICFFCNAIHSLLDGKCVHQYLRATVAKPNSRQCSMCAPDKGFYSAT